MSHKYVSDLGIELDHMKKIDVDRSEIAEEDMPSEEYTPKAKDSSSKVLRDEPSAGFRNVSALTGNESGRSLVPSDDLKNGKLED
jgi:hypothetical protein